MEHKNLQIKDELQNNVSLNGTRNISGQHHLIASLEQNHEKHELLIPCSLAVVMAAQALLEMIATEANQFKTKNTPNFNSNII